MATPPARTPQRRSDIVPVVVPPSPATRRASLQRQAALADDPLTLHAVSVVGVPAEQSELVAAADTLSRLQESPLCYFQWCVLQHAL